MKQLRLRDGDLVLDAAGLGMVEGSAKVRQDLGIAVREALGSDRFHPRWGTILADYVGQPHDSETYMLIRSEISRVISNYIVMQADQMTQDADAGRRSRYAPGEVITSVASIDIQQRLDKVNVRVTVNTSDGRSVSVIRSVVEE